VPMIRPLMTEAVIQLRALNVAGERFRTAAANHFGIDALDVTALGWLGLSGPMSAAQLADAMRVNTSATARMVDDSAPQVPRCPRRHRQMQCAATRSETAARKSLN